VLVLLLLQVAPRLFGVYVTCLFVSLFSFLQTFVELARCERAVWQLAQSFNWVYTISATPRSLRTWAPDPPRETGWNPAPPAQMCWHAPLKAHLSIECKCTAPQIETPILYSPHNNSSVYPTTTTTYVGRTGRITNGMRIGRITLQDSALSSPTLAPTPSDWPSQEQPGFGLTTSAQVSDVSSPAWTDEVRSPLRLVSVAQKNKPLTMLSSNVQSIDLLMDCTAWRCWTMRQSNGCSTPVPRSMQKVKFLLFEPNHLSILIYVFVTNY